MLRNQDCWELGENIGKTYKGRYCCVQENADLQLLMRMIALGLGAWDMIDTGIYREPKLVCMEGVKTRTSHLDITSCSFFCYVDFFFMRKCWEWWRMWPGRSALQMRCLMQGYLGSRPQLERGALGSVVIAGGVKMKMLAIWFGGNRSMAKGASEDRLAHLWVCWRRTPGSPETACQQRWMTGLAGERESWGGWLRSA